MQRIRRSLSVQADVVLRRLYSLQLRLDVSFLTQRRHQTQLDYVFWAFKGLYNLSYPSWRSISPSISKKFNLSTPISVLWPIHSKPSNSRWSTSPPLRASSLASQPCQFFPATLSQNILYFPLDPLTPEWQTPNHLHQPRRYNPAVHLHHHRLYAPCHH